MSSDRVLELERRLTAALNPSFLSIEDQSVAHANHIQAKQSSAGHFRVTLVSESFKGKALVARHQLVYAALNDLIGPEIHAIQIIAKTPEEHL